MLGNDPKAKSETFLNSGSRLPDWVKWTCELAGRLKERAEGEALADLRSSETLGAAS